MHPIITAYDIMIAGTSLPAAWASYFTRSRPDVITVRRDDGFHVAMEALFKDLDDADCRCARRPSPGCRLRPCYPQRPSWCLDVRPLVLVAPLLAKDIFKPRILSYDSASTG